MAETSSVAVIQDKTICDNSMNLEVKDLVNELVERVSEVSLSEKELSNGINSMPKDISNFVETEKRESSSGDSSEDEKIESSAKKSRSSRKRIKSVCENELKEKEIVRRKFGSEGSVLSIGEKIMPPDRQKELNEAIDQYIEKLIKDSILKAVKNVSTNKIFEDIMKDYPIRNNSLSENSEDGFVVEQRLSSDSISELVELENTSDGSNLKRTKCRESLFQGDISEVGNFNNELEDVDHASYTGYLADLEDTASVEDLKSADESLNSSMSSTVEQQSILRIIAQESSETSGNVHPTESLSRSKCKSTSEDFEEADTANADPDIQKNDSSLQSEENNLAHEQRPLPSDSICELNQSLKAVDSTNEIGDEPKSSTDATEQSKKCSDKQEDKFFSDHPTLIESTEEKDQKLAASDQNIENVDLIVMSPEEDYLSQLNDPKTVVDSIPSPDITDTLPQHKVSLEEERKVNWKVGYLHVKLPHKTRGKTHLKAWKKRRVIIQPDEFVNDPKNPSLVISVYGSDSKKHETWHSVPSLKAVVFRSSSRTHRYAFTISDGGEPVIHLSADKESTTQEWMAAIRTVLWPPSPFMELEKMLSGREFEISLIDNEYSYRAGLLGMYGYLSITPKKLTLFHPQQGYVIQEWYLNTVDKFHFVPQPKAEDRHKVLCMTTCSDSSTGQGEIVFFCSEAVTFLQSLASNIHQVLSYHSKQEGGKYQKELEEIAEWLIAPPQDCLNIDENTDEHYKVPPRQVKSLLDIPNFIFNKSLSPVASAIYPAPNSEILEPLDGSKNKPTTVSQDSGISACTSGDDFLNCSTASFVIGGGPMTGKSSDSELSDAYTPPRTPEIIKKTKCEALEEEQLPAGEA